MLLPKQSAGVIRRIAGTGVRAGVIGAERLSLVHGGVLTAPRVESTGIEPQRIAEATASCKCPCCIEVAGHLVCCG
jgi:hypothetical protein